ncbi:MAG: nuclear transport factor 2 family protein, partial [Croceibacterium sp.]
MSEDKLAQLESKLEAMEKRLQRREDELDVRKLQFLYGYLIDKCMYDQVIDLFTDDCEVRFFGGVWRGKEGARRLYCERFRKRFT